MDENESVNTHTQTEQAEADHTGCQKELQQLKDRYMYLNAEFDNYKKRIDREKAQWTESAQDDVLLSILPIVDDMERAREGFKTLPPEMASHAAGLELISKSLSKLLAEYDLQEIPLVKEFDPEQYDAVMQIASETHATGEIVEILQKGYIRHGRVLRPAKVSVAQ